MKIILILLGMALFVTPMTFGQNINLDEYDIYLSDTLISKSDFLQNSKTLSEERVQSIEFKPITDGAKTYYYLNGQIEGVGDIKAGQKEGYWEFWYSNGLKAREGEFLAGKPNGTHKYWYENGNLRAIGNWKNGVYDGIWEIYNENGEEKEVQEYKNGELIEK